MRELCHASIFKELNKMVGLSRDLGADEDDRAQVGWVFYLAFNSQSYFPKSHAVAHTCTPSSETGCSLSSVTLLFPVLFQAVKGRGCPPFCRGDCNRENCTSKNRQEQLKEGVPWGVLNHNKAPASYMTCKALLHSADALSQLGGQLGGN